VDPLSEVLALLKPQSYSSGGFGVGDDIAIQFGRHVGIKCYAVMSGHCWLRVESVPEPVHLQAGDCFILPRGLPFSLATDLSLPPIDFQLLLPQLRAAAALAEQKITGNYLAGGHFVLTGSHAAVLLQSLPPIVHIAKESDKAVMRWSLERMKEELRNPQPGGALIAQQLAYMMLVQALRLHLADDTRTGTGWLFALADKQMSAALACMHEEPERAWTLQSLAERVGMSRSIFALRFKQTAGATPMEYLTRWRMLLAGEKLKTSTDPIAAIACSLGYDSESAFSKAFRRVLGCSPRQHRRGEQAAASLLKGNETGLLQVAQI
jgi:AraC-like DNA-binding protein